MTVGNLLKATCCWLLLWQKCWDSSHSWHSFLIKSIKTANEIGATAIQKISTKNLIGTSDVDNLIQFSASWESSPWLSLLIKVILLTPPRCPPRPAIHIPCQNTGRMWREKTVGLVSSKNAWNLTISCSQWATRPALWAVSERSKYRVERPEPSVGLELVQQLAHCLQILSTPAIWPRHAERELSSVVISSFW